MGVVVVVWRRTPRPMAGLFACDGGMGLDVFLLCLDVCARPPPVK